MKESRQLFSAIFETYANKSISLTEVRTRKGGIIQDNLTFTEKEADNIPSQLSLGDYVAFLADIEFKNVQFIEIWKIK